MKRMPFSSITHVALPIQSNMPPYGVLESASDLGYPLSGPSFSESWKAGFRIAGKVSVCANISG